MHQAVKWIRALLKKMLAAGLCIQILLGILWMCANIGEPAQFEEYTGGVIYPLLVTVTRGFESIVRIPYYWFLYVLQLGCALGAAAYGIQSFQRNPGGKWEAGHAFWGSLVLLTVPMAMQCHMAVLPYSLTSSATLALLAGIYRILREQSLPGWRQMIPLYGYWAGMALLIPEYGLLGVIPMVVLMAVLVGRMLRKGARFGANKSILCMLLMVLLGITGAMAGVSHGGVPVSVSLCSRIAWSSIRDYYDTWPQEVRDAVSYDQMTQIADNPEKVETLLWPLLSEQYGDTQAEELLLQVARIAWERNRYWIQHETAWDLVGYSVSPVAVLRQLEGKANASYTGRNYDIMRWNAPGLSRTYLHVSCRLFLAELVVAFLLTITKKRPWRYYLWVGAVMLPFGLGAVCWYTLQGGGQMDYKNTIVLLLLWYLWMVCQVGGQEEIEKC